MLAGTESVLFVHAHPDDETITTGGTIATLVDRGAAVTVLTCTSGERGEELSRAMAILGVTDHRYLGEPDARWAGLEARRYTGAEVTDSVAPDALTAAEPGEVSADIAAVIQRVQPDVVVSYDEDGGSGHPDHVRAHHSARVAAEVMGVPFFAIEKAGARGAMSVDVTPVLDRKRAALAEYGTHVEPIGTVETFRRVRERADTFADHSIPNRIAACVVAAVIGAFAGATLTVAHQASVVVGDLTVPWGIIAAVIITATLLAGLRLVFGTRIVAACGALGLLAVSAFLAIQSVGGSVLVPANPAGYTWTFAPVIIALVVLAWPLFTRRTRDRINSVPAVKGPDHP